MNKGWLIGLVIVSITVIGGYLVFYGTGYKARNTTSNTVQTSTPNSVNIQSFSFSPAILTVKQGTKVTWINNDSSAHQVTSDSSSFSSQQIPSGSKYEFTFDTKGNFSYHCSIHPYMKGEVVVQ